MNIQDYYCVVTQDQADEAKELLVKAGEEIANEELFGFKVTSKAIYLGFDKHNGWAVFEDFLPNEKPTTYPEFKKMLIDKIEGDERKENHKYTAKCPKCKYTSRIPITGFFLDNKNSVHSKHCPIHRLPLERVVYEVGKSKKRI